MSRFWTRPGTHVGFETDSLQWVLLGKIVDITVGPTQQTLIQIPIDVDVSLAAGQSAGFYITNGAIGSQNLLGVRYDGSGTLGSITNSDTNISIKDGAGSYDKFVIFSGSRIFSGVVNYTTGTTGMQESLNARSIEVYPNPASNVLNLEIGTGTANIAIFDAVGNTVLVDQHQGGHLQLNVEELEAGIYNLLIETDKTRTSKVFVKE